MLILCLTIWDILFVLILCFVVLLTTMLVTKSAGGSAGKGYTLNLPLLLGVVLALAVYLGFMLRESRKALRELVKRFFQKQKGGSGT